MKKDKGSRDFIDVRRGMARAKMACRLCLVLLVWFPVSFLGVVAPASAATCVESNCVINVVNERLYASWGVSNLYYNYVPTSQWASKDCIVSSFAIYEGRPASLWYVPAYLVGWTKAYYDGTNWRTFGGDPGKYFLAQITPFHAAADAVLTVMTGNIALALKVLYPNGCSDLPSQQPAQTPSPDTGRPECNDQGL